VIKSFVHKGLELFFRRGSPAKIQAIHVKRLRLILAQLDKAQTIADMNIPSLRLHELRGKRKGEWAVTVQANWRVTFRFVNSNAEDVNYEDYH
jgi:proteic killer suppression protein